jgi:hypothetical protein
MAWLLLVLGIVAEACWSCAATNRRSCTAAVAAVAAAAAAAVAAL